MPRRAAVLAALLLGSLSLGQSWHGWPTSQEQKYPTQYPNKYPTKYGESTGFFPCPFNADFCYHIAADPDDTTCSTLGLDIVTPAGDDAGACDNQLYNPTSAAVANLVNNSDVTNVADSYQMIFHYKFVAEIGVATGYQTVVRVVDFPVMACEMQIDAQASPASIRVVSDTTNGSAFSEQLSDDEEHDYSLTYDSATGDCSLIMIGIESDNVAATSARTIDRIFYGNGSGEADAEFTNVAGCDGICGEAPVGGASVFGDTFEGIFQ